MWVAAPRDQASGERIVGDRLIMRAIAAEVALVEVEGADDEWLADQRRLAGEVGVERDGGAAAAARQGDVGMEGAALGREANADADPFDLGGECG